MNEIISKTIERLQEAGASLRDIKLFHRVDDGDDESVLERDKRLLKEKKARLEQRRQEALKKLEERGFPTLKSKIQPNEDYRSECNVSEIKSTEAESNIEYELPKVRMFGPDPDKPQNRSPYDLDSDRKRFYASPSETQGFPIPLHQPYVSDRAIRAKVSARLSEQTENKVRPEKPISNVFPHLPYKNDQNLTDEDKLAKKYLYTSAYQNDYGKPNWDTESKCRRIYPLRTLETLADPLKSIQGHSNCHPPTSSWQPADFDSSKFDASLPRFDHSNEPRPYEFTTVAPRIDQIPTYSGCHASKDRRVDDDDPYKTYEPITKVRSVVPGQSFFNPQQNIAGYTGQIVDHVKEPTDSHWPPATTGRLF